MKRWMLALVVLAAAGCAGPRVWWKPGVTRAEMQADFAAAREAVYSSGRSDLSAPKDVWGNTAGDLMLSRTMRSRGYVERPAADVTFSGE